MRPGLFLVVAGIVAQLGALASPAPHATYRNPVIADNFPDPMVLRDGPGRYYAYATTSMRGGKALNIQVAKSADLVHWTVLGDALPEKPTWGQRFGDFWAPHVVHAGMTYYLYYAARMDAGEGMAIAVATSRSPEGPFVDSGAPLDIPPGGDTIDPCVADDPASGKSYLYWGSDGKPIRVRELASDRIHFATFSEPAIALDVGKAPYEKLLEGPYVIQRQGWWYLFTSGDDCCDQPHYAVMVARAKTPKGPFQRLAEGEGYRDSVILRGGTRWTGPGHNAVVTDDRGQDWLVYHAVDRKHPRFPNGTDVFRPMLLDRLGYRDGWPVVGLGVPSDEDVPAPY